MELASFFILVKSFFSFFLLLQYTLIIISSVQLSCLTQSISNREDLLYLSCFFEIWKNDFGKEKKKEAKQKL